MHIHGAILPVGTFARPGLARTLAVVGTGLRAWRARDRDRAELADMDLFERRDLPSARDLGNSSIVKPFSD